MFIEFPTNFPHRYMIDEKLINFGNHTKEPWLVRKQIKAEIEWGKINWNHETWQVSLKQIASIFLLGLLLVKSPFNSLMRFVVTSHLFRLSSRMLLRICETLWENIQRSESRKHPWFNWKFVEELNLAVNYLAQETCVSKFCRSENENGCYYVNSNVKIRSTTMYKQSFEMKEIADRKSIFNHLNKFNVNLIRFMLSRVGFCYRVFGIFQSNWISSQFRHRTAEK